jgi:cystathionine beta-lyase
VKKDTLLTHVARDPAKYEGMVNTPVYRTSTVIFPDLESYEARSGDDYKKVRYGLYGTPTTFALEEAIAKMEGGHAAVVVPSGLAAIAAPLAAFLKAGDHLLVVDSVYGPTRTFCERHLKPNGVEVQYYDPLIGAAIEKLLKANTKAVFCESPGSLTFEMQDIPAIAAAAHARGLPVLADTTWGTPYFYRPFDHGIDVSIHAGTKYINGHSDVLLGAIVTNERCWKTVRKTVAEYGYCVSPDDCYMALRGFRTIGVRMKHQMASALTVARWLKSRPEVKRVIYPALEGDAGHTLWKRDFEGAARCSPSSSTRSALRRSPHSSTRSNSLASVQAGAGSASPSWRAEVPAPRPRESGRPMIRLTSGWKTRTTSSLTWSGVSSS